MRIGVARRDITPPPGVDLAGFLAREGPSLGVHDPLFATALVAEERGRRVALVVADLICLGAATVARVRAAVERETGIPTTSQMYACTHTHGSPETGVLTSMGSVDPSYMADFERTLVAVVREAVSDLVPARIGWSRGECHMAHNRVLALAG